MTSIHKQADELKLDVTVGDGKYTVQMNSDGRLVALRYGEEWRDCCGEGLIYQLAATVQELRERLNRRPSSKAEQVVTDNVEEAPYSYARRLFLHLAPNCEPSSDLLILLTQIENAICKPESKDGAPNQEWKDYVESIEHKLMEAEERADLNFCSAEKWHKEFMELQSALTRAEADGAAIRGGVGAASESCKDV